MRQRATFAGRPIPSKHDYVLRGHKPFRGNAATSVTGCCLARRSGYLVLAGTRATPFRPIRQRRRCRAGGCYGQASDSQLRLQVTANRAASKHIAVRAATESRAAGASATAPGRSTTRGCAPLAICETGVGERGGTSAFVLAGVNEGRRFRVRRCPMPVVPRQSCLDPRTAPSWRGNRACLR